MHRWHRWGVRVRALFRPDRIERELQFHLDQLVAENLEQGMSPEDAERRARVTVGNLPLLREDARAIWRWRWLDVLTQDVVYGVRRLRRTAGFTLVAVVTLGLGIGASTAIFSVAYGVSLRPLPYPQPDRLIRVYEANPANGQPQQEVSAGAFHAWREGATSIESMALFTEVRTWVLAGSVQETLTSMSVTPAFFDVLGATPILGPGFKSEREYTRYTAAEEAMLSYAAWQRLFGGSPNVVGEPLVIAGLAGNDAYRIVGVLPQGFAFGPPVDVWRPQIVELPLSRGVRRDRDDRVVARLRPGATIEMARAQLETVAGRLASDFPSIHGGWTVTVELLHESIIGDFGRATWLLLVAVVLLVTCVNVGGLLAARAVARERETAVRVALGAAWWRLLTHWLAETSVLGVLGASLGLLLAWSGVAALKAAAPPGIPRLDAVALDLPTLAVATLSTALAVLILTVAPLRRLTRPQLVDRLRAGSAAAGDSRTRRTTRGVLTVAQCAGAAALVILAVLLSRSFIRLMSLELGWNAAGVLSLNLSPPMPPELRTPWYRYVEWSDRLIAQLELMPGIERAAITTQVPLSPQSYPSTLARGRGRVAGDEERWPVVEHVVTDGYFDVMEMRLVDGRTFDRDDRFSEAQLTTRWGHRGAAIVSASTARALWPDRPALGEALWLRDGGGWHEVVGVADDLQFHAVGEAPALHVFLPWTQLPTGRPRLVVKGPGRAASIAPVVRDVVQTVESGTLVYQVAPLDTLVSRATAQPRFTSRVVAAFGVLALVLAAIGIYGTVSSLVSARAREIGIRLALGAPRRGIVSTILWRGLVPAIAGGVVGLAMAAALARAFRALLFDLEPLDAGSFAGGAALLLLVAAAAALGPAYRAARVDPAVALRTE